ncbi:tol-pal system protein [Paracoccus sp. S-4012]|uniref:tol-pal system protein n=1 Tax=Paracoccus sp. S-4012 TaxID=2665648 RepID=UPI0012B05195|nr:tol-pal system protein [Paracoccus sp. S-4012]MRX49155.1 tol-pal system protein [Paracoccus sp. S-4012]
MRALALALPLLAAMTGAAPAQGLDIALDAPPAGAVAPETLAQIRADLAAMSQAVTALRAEMVAAGPQGYEIAGGPGAIERMDAMEAEIARLTGEVERLGQRVETALAEATNRAGDIEFRLCEIDPGCDLGALTTAQMQGGSGMEVLAMPAPVPAAAPAQNPAEQADFSRAVEAMNTADPAGAAAQFAAFATAHPQSPLVPEALYLQGEALAAAGDGTGAGKAWLAAYTAAPEGPRAAPALIGVAGVIAAGGRQAEACTFLAEVGLRYAGSPSATEAENRAAALGCEGGAVPDDAGGG